MCGKVLEMPKEPPIPQGYLLGGDGKARLEQIDTCRRGHPVTQVGTGPCPHCRVLTMRWYCADLRCDGTRVSTAHQKVCGQKR